uniref:Chemokine interleukin-8-like domain-containing protein n=1 Tax=Echeneis naucrates TaxID=173247 RepID=A0A665V3L1_ECHNA
MKTLPVVFLLSLICLLRRSSCAPIAPELMLREGCCPKFSQTRIPYVKVKHVAMTPYHCSQKNMAIVVTSVCNKKFCIDPNLAWAKRLLSEFEKSPNGNFNKSKCDVK